MANEMLYKTLASEVFCSFILKNNKKKKHIMSFKILEAIESFVPGSQGLGVLSLPSQEGQEFTWGNVFCLGGWGFELQQITHMYLHI